MSLYLVRHAKAGSRSDWSGADHQRPLTKKGVAQAVVLADRLAPLAPPRLLSSPYLRCRQTLGPLASKLTVEIESTELLTEGAAYEPVLELLATFPDSTVLCSHGDLIPDVVAALHRRHVPVHGPVQWGKGATWVIDREGDQIVRLEAWPPPET